jgi:dihydrofolate reductase
VARDAVAVVARADNGVIGRGNGLPWRLPDDLKRFKSLTTGHSVLMGRRTWDSIGKPLPGRRNLVLTRDRGWHAAGAEPVHSLDEARARAGEATLFVIGGAEVFSLAWPIIGRLELTEVHASPDGDVRLTGFDRRDWREVSRVEHAGDERHSAPFSFVTLVRDR